MPRKKIEVVELNKKEEKIILEESSSPIILFWRRHRGLILSLLMALALAIFSISLFLFFKNMKKNDVPNISEAKVDTSLTDSISNIATDLALTDETARRNFISSGAFVKRGEVLLVKKIETSNATIKFFSDGTALKIPKNGKNITRINPLGDGSYGINEAGVISSKASTSEVSIIETKKFPWGDVTYFSDNSAEVTNSKMDLFVRCSDDVKDNYISDSKVTYLKETKTVGGTKLNYYHDGTIEVIKNNTSYLVRKESDLSITSDVTFINNNAAEIYKTIHTNNGETIDYYTDGGAIIRNGNNTLSVRKSNSIVINNNNIYEITDSIYVTESKKTPNATYYTNGSAVINYNGKVLYIPENSDITYNPNGTINGIGSNAEELVKESNAGSTNVKNFTTTAVVTTPEFIAILPKDNVIYDKNGEIKELRDGTSEDNDLVTKFTITNNTNETVRFRVVIQQSNRTTVDVNYLRFQIQARGKYIGPAKLNDMALTNDQVSELLNINGINYMLIEDSLEAYATTEVSLMLWADYDTIPNSQMDKYFYGTIRVYAYQEN